MADAIVTTLLDTGVRVDELVRLTWADITLQPRSGRAEIRSGKGSKVRLVPLNTFARDALGAIRPAAAEGALFRWRGTRTRGCRTGETVR